MIKKILTFIIMFILLFVSGCYEETPKALAKMKEFDKAKTSEFNLSLGMGNSEVELFKYAYKENEYTYLEILQDIGICYITDLENNYQYYDDLLSKLDWEISHTKYGTYANYIYVGTEIATTIIKGEK